MNINVVDIMKSSNIKESNKDTKNIGSKDKFSKAIKTIEKKIKEDGTKKSSKKETIEDKNFVDKDVLKNEDTLDSDKNIEKETNVSELFNIPNFNMLMPMQTNVNEIVDTEELILVEELDSELKNINADIDLNLDLEAPINKNNVSNNSFNLDLSINQVDNNIVQDIKSSIEVEELVNLNIDDSNGKEVEPNEIKTVLANLEVKSRLNLNSANRVITNKEITVDENIDKNMEIPLKSVTNVDSDKDTNLDSSADENIDNMNLEFKELLSTNNVNKNEKSNLFTNVERPKILNLDEINTQMIKIIETTNEGEINTMKVQLYPKDLGTLDISVSLENGNLKAKILVENDSVKSLFTKNLEDLNQNLLKQNIEIKEFIVDVNSGFNEKNQNTDQKNNKRDTFIKEFTLSEDEDVSSRMSEILSDSNLSVLA